jgi:hypothetical protein
VCLGKFLLNHFTRTDHLAFECAIWYWHFVDVVRIFLYLSVYLWPSVYFFREDIFFWRVDSAFCTLNLNLKAASFFFSFFNPITDFDYKLYNKNEIKRDYIHFYFFINTLEDLFAFFYSVFYYSDGFNTYFYYYLGYVWPLFVLIIFGSGVVLPFLLFLLYFNLIRYSVDNKLSEIILIDVLPRAIRIFFQFDFLPAFKNYLTLYFKKIRSLADDMILLHQIIR